jgi:hypothetical protein
MLLISTLSDSSLAQDEDSRVLDDIGSDWSTNMILVYVETPNKFDRTYGTNITDKAVLDEISAVEEAMNPQKEDYGEVVDITFVLSISTLIKEINVAPENIADAVKDELNLNVDPDIPGDHEYAIPEDQDEIDRIVDQIPYETLDTFVRDTNDDGIWDSAVVWMGTLRYSTAILKDLDSLIDRYYVDPDVERSDFNSRDEWWMRIETGSIHCAMTNLGYGESYDYYYNSSDEVELGLTAAVILILIGLLFSTYMVSKSILKRRRRDNPMTKRVTTAMVILVVLIGICIPIGLIKTTASLPDKLSQFSNEMDGGQLGMVVTYGSPAPPDDQELRGSGSMKDIEVLDSIDRLEEELRSIEGINPPISVVDVMKLIKVPESMVNQIPVQNMPDPIKSRIEEFANTSFWDAIHTAGQIDSLIWYARYDKSLQDSIINIFYKSITFEMRSTFVNQDFSRSLVYLSIPMIDGDQTKDMKNSINNVINHHQPFISTSHMVLINTGSTTFENMDFVLKIMLLFVMLIIGIFIFIFILAMARTENERKDESL